MTIKDLVRGTKERLNAMLESVTVILEDALRRNSQRSRYVLRIPKTKPIGKVFYTVQSTIEPVTFYKRKDAETFKRLLNQSSTGLYQADIIRREVTEEGFIPTYGDENVKKN